MARQATYNNVTRRCIGLKRFLAVSMNSSEIFLLIGLFIVYFLPPWIASIRNHQNSTAIFFMTLLMGWTGLGWLVALGWSLTSTCPCDARRGKTEL
jgi:hypothetical protein